MTFLRVPPFQNQGIRNYDLTWMYHITTSLKEQVLPWWDQLYPAFMKSEEYDIKYTQALEFIPDEEKQEGLLLTVLK